MRIIKVPGAAPALETQMEVQVLASVWPNTDFAGHLERGETQVEDSLSLSSFPHHPHLFENQS